MAEKKYELGSSDAPTTVVAETVTKAEVAEPAKKYADDEPRVPRMVSDGVYVYE